MMRRAAIVIVTRNRRDELRVALRSAFKQTVPVEVVVADDGSTDGTAEMVAREFPHARLLRFEQSQGPSIRRNEATQTTSADVVFAIDDDAEFVSERTVEQTLEDFADARVGAVAIPCVEPKKGNVRLQTAPDPAGIWITECFIGTACAVRRDVFQQIEGFRQDLFYYGEESDYCIRMLRAGYVVRLGRADAIHHYESPKRDMTRMDYYARRNDVLFAWHYAPTPILPLHMIGTAVNGVRTAFRTGRYRHMLRGTAAGFTGCLTRLGERLPVPAPLYRLHRSLKKAGSMRLEEVVACLPH